MLIGILADIHEANERLREALNWFDEAKTDKIVLLGDVFNDGSRLNETVSLLQCAGAVGVWGNHDLGLSFQPDDWVRERFGPAADFFAALRPSFELADCLFTHGAPWWDATDPVIFYLGDRPDDPANVHLAFDASQHRVFFSGHQHLWFAGTPAGRLDWGGCEPIRLAPPQRYLVVVHAVLDGWCATYDTETCKLTPRALS